MKTLLILLFFITMIDAKIHNHDIETINKKIGNTKELARLYTKRAKLHSERHAYKKALTDYKIAMLLNPTDQDLKYKIAKAYVGAQMPKIAISYTKEVLETKISSGKRARYLIVQADAYVLLEQYDVAISIYETQNKSTKGLNPTESLKLAQIYYDMGSTRECIKTLKDALRQERSNYLIAQKLVEISIEEGSYTLAHEIVNRMINNKKSLAQIYYLQAQVFEAQNKLKEAMQSNSNALKHFAKLSNKQSKKKTNQTLKENLLDLKVKLNEDLLAVN